MVFDFLDNDHINIVHDNGVLRIIADKGTCLAHGAQHMIEAFLFEEDGGVRNYFSAELYLTMADAGEDVLLSQAMAVIIRVFRQFFGDDVNVIEQNFSFLRVGYRGGNSFEFR